jgi:hypothetical protein
MSTYDIVGATDDEARGAYDRVAGEGAGEERQRINASSLPVHYAGAHDPGFGFGNVHLQSEHGFASRLVGHSRRSRAASARVVDQHRRHLAQRVGRSRARRYVPVQFHVQAARRRERISVGADQVHSAQRGQQCDPRRLSRMRGTGQARQLSHCAQRAQRGRRGSTSNDELTRHAASRGHPLRDVHDRRKASARRSSAALVLERRSLPTRATRPRVVADRGRDVPAQVRRLCRRPSLTAGAPTQSPLEKI